LNYYKITNKRSVIKIEKKSKYGLIGFAFLSIIVFNLNVYAQYPTYKVGVENGSELIREVTIVDPVGLEELLGPTWKSKTEMYFGSTKIGAKYKERVIQIYDNETLNYELYPMNAFTIRTEVWDWTTTEFSSTPDWIKVYYTFYDPNDVQALCEVNGRNVSIYDWWFRGGNPTYFVGLYFIYLPLPVDNYLAAIEWDTGWTVSGNNLTGVNAVAPRKPTWFLNNYTITLMYDHASGALIYQNLQENESNVIYEVVGKYIFPTIPGYDLPIFLSITSLAIICLIYIIMKKK